MELYITCLPTDSLPEDPQRLSTMIRDLPFGQDEQERLLRITHTDTLRQSLGAKLALRQLLEERHLPMPWTVLRSPTGKPFFDSDALPAFSLSHSGALTLAVLADRPQLPIGADLQFIDPRRSTDRLSPSIFTPREQAEYAAAEDPQAYFFRRWTQKEAVAKQSGEGLSSILKREVEDAGLHLQTLLLRHNGKTAYISLATPEEVTLLHFIDFNKELSYERLSN